MPRPAPPSTAIAESVGGFVGILVPVSLTILIILHAPPGVAIRLCIIALAIPVTFVSMIASAIGAQWLVVQFRRYTGNKSN